MKRSFFYLVLFFAAGAAMQAQQLYSNSFGNLVLSNYTSGTLSCNYTTVPNGMALINDGFANNVGTNSNPNTPFYVPALKNAGWMVAYSSFVNDTFLVSTSWLDDPTITVDRWVITPTVNIAANTVLTWLAMSPDAAFPDGYEVYGTDKTTVLTADSFHLGDRIFSLPDGNTTGGGEKKTWTRRSVNVGALFAGKDLRFAFRNNSKNMFQLWIDDIEVKTLAYNLDASPVDFIAEKYFLTNTSQTVGVNITNYGATNIQTITLNYQYGTSPVETQTFGFSDGLSYLQTATVAFALPYSISSPGSYPLKSWISSANGISDQNTSNDTLKTFVCVMSSSPAKNVLLEQFVSAFDGDSPEAQDTVLNLQSAQVIVVNVHDADSLKDPNASGVINAYKKNSSTALVDRTYFYDLASVPVNRMDYYTKLVSRLQAITPASVSIVSTTFNPVTRALSFTVKADFTGDVRGDYRINAYLIEDQVYGPVSDTTANGYNQFNNYFYLPWSPYYQVGSYSALYNTYVMNGWKFKHQDVLVHSFDGSFGIAGTIPANGGTAGQSYQQTYTLTVPTLTNSVHKFNPDNMYIVGFVAEYNNDVNKRNILNVAKTKITGNAEVVGIKEQKQAQRISIYPNPSAGKIYFNSEINSSCTISVYNLEGKEVRRFIQPMNAGVNGIDLGALSEGAYMINVDDGKNLFSEKLIIQRR
jgi:peptidoglycan hydrolase-like protein with peptidoglycan-binding domain